MVTVLSRTVGRVSRRFVPTCVWLISPELLVALDQRFGEPVDAYVNGSQVWLRDDGPDGITVEWRLHPVAGYRRPEGVGTYDIFSASALAAALGEPPPAPPESLWDGLEAFPAHGDETEPQLLRAAATEALTLAPAASGLVDHEVISEQWEKGSGRVSIIEALLHQLSS